MTKEHTTALIYTKTIDINKDRQVSVYLRCIGLCLWSYI